MGALGGGVVARLGALVLLASGALVGALGQPAAAAPATLVVCPAAGAGCDHTSITAAVAAAAAGDTVYVRNGTYRETTILVTRPVTIRGESRAGVVIDGGGTIKPTSPATINQAGLFRIAPPNATAGGPAGAIRIEHLTARNPSRTSTGTVWFTVSIVMGNFARTSVTAIEMDDLDLSAASGDPSQGSYAIYANGGWNATVGDRTAPSISLTGSRLRDHRLNGIGLDAWRGDALVEGNDLAEGTNRNPAVLVMNEYTPSRMPNPVVVRDNDSAGRLIGARNAVPAGAGLTFGGYDDIQVLGNRIDLDAAGLVDGQTAYGVLVASNLHRPADQDPARASQGTVVVEGNQVTATHRTDRLIGVQLRGLVTDARVRGNDLPGLGTGVSVELDGDRSPSAVRVARNRLFADRVGVANETATAVDATENWWGCVEAPPAIATPSLPAEDGCAAWRSTGSGSVDVDPWIQPRASAATTTLETGASTAVKVTLDQLSDGSPLTPLGLLDARAVAWSADRGVVAPASGTLDAQRAHDATYTAPGTSGTDTVRALVDRHTNAAGVHLGQPARIPLTIVAPTVTEPETPESPGTTPETPDSPDGPSEPEVGGSTDTPPAGAPDALPDTGAPALGGPMGLAALLLAAGLTLVGTCRRPRGRHARGVPQSAK
ncbi:hypothetical protein [Nocardioides sp. LML1-1-1.1]|uniref:hypothetical protein n=1 Tax=Nocardioides sp. LML1-1-1.1 TaxID=3135248 RepID=UPI00341C433E